MKHEVINRNGQFVCRLCQWTWKSEPVSECPGVPRYGWGQWLPNLKTKTQLRRMRMTPGAEPRGAYYRNCRVGKSDQFLWLYDVNEALPSNKLRIAVNHASNEEAK